MKVIKLITIATLVFLGFSCKHKVDEVEPETQVENVGTLTLMFENKMKGLDGSMTDLKLNTEFKTANGDTVQFSKFKYYISNVQLTDKDGKITKVANSYHLVSSTAMMNMSKFDLPLPSGDYETVTFSLGVDKTANHDETIIQGDLDPNNDMVWNWMMGYRFTFFEGKYNLNSGDNNFLYHIGMDMNYVTYTKDLPKTLKIVTNKKTELHLMANFNKFFDGVNTIDVNTINNVKKGPADQVKKLVDNYKQASLFMIHHIENPE